MQVNYPIDVRTRQEMLWPYLSVLVVLLHQVAIGHGHRDIFTSKLLNGYNFGERHRRQLGSSGFNWRAVGNTDDVIFFDDNFDFNSRSGASSTTRRPATTRRFQGSTVEIPGMGTTRSPCEDACQITSEYNPVCADDGTTYFSVRRLKCAQNCGKRVRMSHSGACTHIPETPIGG